MKDEFSTYLKKAGDEIFLSEDERARMRRTIRAYMEMKPLRASADTSRSLPASPLYRPFAPRAVAAALVFALFASSGGISYAARSALPGDILYPVKTRFNEPLEGALAISQSAKTTWAIGVANARIQEAAELAASGDLGTSTRRQLQDNFEVHAQIASDTIARQASSSPEMGASEALQFEAQLSEYQHVLVQVGVADHPDVEALAASVGAQRRKFAAIRGNAERQIAAGDSGQRNAAISHLRDAAKKQLGLSLDLAREHSNALASSSAESIALQLAGASTTISNAENLPEGDAAPQALDALQSALTATEKIGVFLRTSSAIRQRSGMLISQSDQDERTSSTVKERNVRGSDREEEKVDVP